MNSGKLITLGVVGIGIWFLYEWITSQCETVGSPFFGGSLCSMVIGTPVASVTAPLSIAPVTTPTPATGPSASETALATLLLQAAGFSSGASYLSADQWAYYYNSLPGRTIPTGQVMENILTSLGLTDATRGTPISVSAFITALAQNGLNGLEAAFSSGWVPAYAIGGY